MMMLGDVLALARRSGSGLDGWLRPADPALADRAEAAAAQAGTDLGGYLSGAVAAFTDHASEEDWATLTSRLRNAEDPGRSCVLTMIRWRLDRDGAPAAGAAADSPMERTR